VIATTLSAGLAPYYSWVIYFLSSKKVSIKIGTYLAGFCFPYLANWKGRKMAIYISVALGGVGMVVIGAANHIAIVMVFIVLAGIAFGGFEIIAIVYTAELSGELVYCKDLSKLESRG